MADFSSGELGLEHILQRLMDQYQPQASPASISAVQALPRLRVPDSTQDSAAAGPTAACKIGDACTVCHDDFQEGGEVLQLPCKHCFHQDCLMPWLESVGFLSAPLTLCTTVWQNA